MNYFEHHIGDYDSATAHLSWLEDCAYRRLLCLYYRTEAPIPADEKQVFRLLRASSRQERDAIQQVLGEFFVLAEDGYHQARCDREIAAYTETIPDREAKRENDRERQRRTRERRKGLFEALRAHNIVPAYDTKTADLESLLSQAKSRMESRDVTAPVTRDNTATHLPSPTTHYPVPSDVEHPQVGAPAGASSRPLTAKDLEAEGVEQSHAADWLKVRKAKKVPLTLTAWEAVKREAAVAGITPAKAVQLSAENGWQGFKASWLQRDQQHAGRQSDVFAGAVL